MAGISQRDTTAMATAARQLENAVDQVKAQQTSLANQQETMMTGWVGESGSAFTAAFTAFNADFNKVIQAMQGLQEALTKNTQNYVTNESANTTAVNKIRSAING